VGRKKIKQDGKRPSYGKKKFTVQVFIQFLQNYLAGPGFSTELEKAVSKSKSLKPILIVKFNLIVYLACVCVMKNQIF